MNMYSNSMKTDNVCQIVMIVENMCMKVDNMYVLEGTKVDNS